MDAIVAPVDAQAHPVTSAHSVVPPIITPLLSNASERERIITPYRADVFESTLRAFGLLSKYPDLCNRLRFGFPIGDFPTLQKSYTPPNHSSGIQHSRFISQYIQEQVSLNHMSGPYSANQVEAILGSHFVTSPLSVVEKSGSPGKFRLVQNCSFRNEDSFSVNDFIDSDEFPTTWGTAAEVAQIVSNDYLVSVGTCLCRSRGLCTDSGSGLCLCRP